MKIAEILLFVAVGFFATTSAINHVRISKLIKAEEKKVLREDFEKSWSVDSGSYIRIGTSDNPYYAENYKSYKSYKKIDAQDLTDDIKSNSNKLNKLAEAFGYVWINEQRDNIVTPAHYEKIKPVKSKI